MTEITINETLEVNHILSYRAKIKMAEFNKVATAMEEKMRQRGIKRVANAITATFAVENDAMDMELLIPIDKKVENFEEYKYKEKLKLVNAARLTYKGNPAGLQNACNELNQYIAERQLQPITVGYNVTKHMDPINMDNTEIHVYVGINPNEL